MDAKWANADRPETFELTDWNPWARSGGVDFPLNALPSAAADWARMRARQTGADVSAFAVASLQLVSGVTGHGTRLQPKRHEAYTIGPTMWSMLVGLPGTKKSIAVGNVQRTLKTIEQRFAKLRTDAVARLKQEGNADADKTVPPARRFVANDSTIEKLSEILSHQDTGITLLRDELSGWLNSMDRYGHSGDRSFWLEAAGGGSYTVDRIKGSRDVANLSISLFGGIQPDKLNNIPSLSEDGLFQRFLPMHMSDAGAEVDEPYDTDITGSFMTALDKLAILEPTAFRLDAGAGAAWLKFSNEMTALSKTTAPSPAFGTFLAKQARTLGMLALLLHLVDMAPDVSKDGVLSTAWLRASDGPQSQYEIPLATLVRARTILEEFFLPHAWVFYAETTAKGDDLINIATMLLKAADDGRLRLTVRDMTRGTHAITKLKSDHAKIGAVLTPFVANNWMRPESEARDNHTWVLNPALKGHLSGEMRRQVEVHRRIIAKITGRHDLD